MTQNSFLKFCNEPWRLPFYASHCYYTQCGWREAYTSNKPGVRTQVAGQSAPSVTHPDLPLIPPKAVNSYFYNIRSASLFYENEEKTPLAALQSMIAQSPDNELNQYNFRPSAFLKAFFYHMALGLDTNTEVVSVSSTGTLFAEKKVSRDDLLNDNGTSGGHSGGARGDELTHTALLPEQAIVRIKENNDQHNRQQANNGRSRFERAKEKGYESTRFLKAQTHGAHIWTDPDNSKRGIANIGKEYKTIGSRHSAMHLAGAGLAASIPSLLKHRLRNSWIKRNGRIAIEDPFERDYDVGHVLTDSTCKLIRREMLQAYAKLISAYDKENDFEVQQRRKQKQDEDTDERESEMSSLDIQLGSLPLSNTFESLMQKRL
eukprot:g2500.t1